MSTDHHTLDLFGASMTAVLPDYLQADRATVDRMVKICSLSVDWPIKKNRVKGAIRLEGFLLCIDGSSRFLHENTSAYCSELVLPERWPGYTHRESKHSTGVFVGTKVRWKKQTYHLGNACKVTPSTEMVCQECGATRAEYEGGTHPWFWGAPFLCCYCADPRAAFLESYLADSVAVKEEGKGDALQASVGLRSYWKDAGPLEQWMRVWGENTYCGWPRTDIRPGRSAEHPSE